MTDRSPLTRQQAAVLAVIRAHVDLNGYPPSIREIGDAVGMHSPSSVVYTLRGLEDRGYIRRVPYRPRAIQVADPGAAT